MITGNREKISPKEGKEKKEKKRGKEKKEEKKWDYPKKENPTQGTVEGGIAFGMLRKGGV